jgi:fluoride ion exporter CrcB/FEX
MMGPAAKEHVANICCLSLFSIFGAAARIILQELFGQACHLNDVGWNKSSWAPCTTAPGFTSSTGGALFVDLPANVVGCFVMGLLISGDEYVGTPVDLPIAFLKRSSKFQHWTLLHTGIRTGFLGSLTTFASWNTQMVVMMWNGEGTVLDSQWVSAIFGYVIGLGMALCAFVVGRHTAICLHRWNNPDLRKEADEIADKRGLGVFIHRDLPDMERRFLHDIFLDENVENDGWKENDLEDSTTENLRRWKRTTDDHRNGRVDGGQFLSELRQIERAIMVRDEEPRQELLDLARDAGWDLEALRNWRQDGKERSNNQIHLVSAFPLWVISSLLVILVALLLWASIVLDGGKDVYKQTYRISALSTLIAPIGTICRYYLSALNGSIKKRRWEWVPLGTLLANLIASVVSALAVALQISDNRNELALLWLSAIKGGFAGCLSTVSTFSAEVVGLARALPRRGWAYYYSIGSLLLACVLGTISYAWAII